MDYILAALRKPYVVILDGHTSRWELMDSNLTADVVLQWAAVSGLLHMRISESPRKTQISPCLKRRSAIALM
jgi:hypothetical protein